jgi:hypothetical protein
VEEPVDVRRRTLLAKLPVAGRALRTIDALRDERDGLRRQRDGLRRQRDELRAELRQVHKELERSRALTDPPLRETVAVEALRAPSLLARSEALRRVRQHARASHGRADAVWAYNAKDTGAALARSLGVRTPTLLEEPCRLVSLREPEGRCVVKPVHGASSRGVLALVPQDDGRWLDLNDLEAGARDWETLRGYLQQLVNTRQVSDRFLVEELIDGPSQGELPLDWKLVCVGGEVAFSWARDRRNSRALTDSRYRHFSRQWEDLGPLRYPDRHDPTIPEPHHPDELVAVAELIAQALPTIFVRVDLFDPPSGVVFGEITPQSGSALWVGPELDREYGERWDRAEALSWVEG